ncbi:SPFH domain-containing protein, partial [Streptomyces sp. ECR3]
MSTTTSRTEGSRHGRVIHGESTLEIPVHLLFRDDPGGAAPAPGAPEVRLRPVPTMPAAPSAPQVPAAASVPSSGGDGPGGRSARMLPGALGVLAGVCGATGCLLTSW